MANIRNAQSALADAITKAKRIEREAQSIGQLDLGQKVTRLRRELEDLEYELERVSRESS
jgi:ubiquinone biosynthesis protein UbiJ